MTARTAWRSDEIVRAGADFVGLHAECSDLAARTGRALPVYHTGHRVLVGPLYRGTDGPCLGCLEYRLRLATDAINLTHPEIGLWCGTRGVDAELGLDALVDHVVAAERPEHPRMDGIAESAWEMCHVVDESGVSQHRLYRSVGCYLQHHHRPRPALDRGGRLSADLRTDRFADPRHRDEFLRHTADALVGPVTGTVRMEVSYGAMTGVVVPQSKNMGFGRGTRFRESDFTAVMEAFERMCGYPFDEHDFYDTSALPADAVRLGPAELGGYHESQLACPTSRIVPAGREPDRWVEGLRFTEAPTRIFVPADVAFYNYEPAHGLDYHTARRDSATRRDKHYVESSSGSAIGSSPAEAALHALLEVLERDAFLRFWYREDLVPGIDLGGSLTPACDELINRIDAAGYHTAALVLPSPAEVPVVAAFAVHRAGVFPYVMCTAGSGGDWDSALEAALWELVNIVRNPTDRTESQIRSRLATKWAIETIDDHIDFHLLPENGRAVVAKTRGPRIPLPILRARVIPSREHTATVSGAATIAGIGARLRGAGLDDPIFVDQGNAELGDLGLHAMKCIVPGALPMTFGMSHLRVKGLQTLRAIGRGDLVDSADRLEPHPFP
ncbi:YcaO-like family protein [Nocardia nova]|uniref:YcaO-like family protein n=1 Tax=Nocardia nova TaxID=37330 RepID=UPI0033C1F290